MSQLVDKNGSGSADVTDRTQGNAMEGFISLAPKMIRSSIGRWYFPKSPARIAIGPGAKGRTFESCRLHDCFQLRVKSCYAVRSTQSFALNSHQSEALITIQNSISPNQRDATELPQSSKKIDAHPAKRIKSAPM